MTTTSALFSGVAKCAPPMDTSPADESSIRDAEEQTWCTGIAQRIGAGDVAAEGLLVSRLQPGLLMILRARCQQDFALAADLCQDTFLILLKRLREGTLQDPSRVAAFAAQTARQLAFDSRRRTLIRKTTVDSDAIENTVLAAPPDDSLDRASAGAVVRKMLAELPHDRDREVLKRFYLMEQEKSEICRQLSLAPGAFDQVVFRARARLREMLAARGLRSRDLLCVLLPGVPRSWLN